MPNDIPRFHLAFPVHDLTAARHFYCGLLGCSEGRSAEDWVDFDFYGHQIVAHLTARDGVSEDGEAEMDPTNEVDGEDVPVRHFGVILDMDGTILDLAYDNYFWRELIPERYAQKHGLTVEHASTFNRIVLEFLGRSERAWPTLRTVA